MDIYGNKDYYDYLDPEDYLVNDEDIKHAYCWRADFDCEECPHYSAEDQVCNFDK